MTASEERTERRKAGWGNFTICPFVNCESKKCIRPSESNNFMEVQRAKNSQSTVKVIGTCSPKYQ